MIILNIIIFLLLNIVILHLIILHIIILHLIFRNIILLHLIFRTLLLGSFGPIHIVFTIYCFWSDVGIRGVGSGWDGKM